MTVEKVSIVLILVGLTIIQASASHASNVDNAIDVNKPIL